MTTEEFKSKSSATLKHLQEELKKVRTGRAHPDMLDSVKVEVYGSPAPLNQIANITAPEPQQLRISPFDPNNLSLISEAISKNESLGLSPSDDGRVIRIMVPLLTEERRTQIAKQLGSYAEDTRISLRNLRHTYLDEIKDAKKDGQISEDDFRRLEKELGELMDSLNKDIEETIKLKEREIMSV